MKKNLKTLLRKNSELSENWYSPFLPQKRMWIFHFPTFHPTCLILMRGLPMCVWVAAYVCVCVWVCGMSLCRWSCGFSYLPNACRSTCLQMAQSNFQIVFTITTKSICKYPSNNKCHAHAHKNVHESVCVCVLCRFSSNNYVQKAVKCLCPTSRISLWTKKKKK